MLESQLDSSSFFCFTDTVDKNMASDLRAFQNITNNNTNSPSPILGESSQLLESSSSWAETSVSHGSRRRKTKGVILNTKKMEKLVNITSTSERMSPYSSPENVNVSSSDTTWYNSDVSQATSKKDIVRGLQTIKQKGKQRLSQLGSNNKSPTIHNEGKSHIKLSIIIKLQRQFRSKMLKLFNDVVIGKVIRINAYRRVYANDYNKDNNAIKYLSLKYIRGCIKMIELWWKRLVLRRSRRYTQYSKWTSRQSSLLFACILGWRVRFLMKNEKVINIKKAIKDIQHILMDIISSTGKGADSKSTSSTRSNQFAIDMVRESIKSGNERSVYPLISYMDWTLVKTLLKQLKSKNKEFRSVIFHGARWRICPAPGYYSLYQSVKSEAMKGCLKQRIIADADRNSKLPSPPIVKPAQVTVGPPPIPAVLFEVKQSDNCNSSSAQPLVESSKDLSKELNTLRKHLSSMPGGPKVDSHRPSEASNLSTSSITPSPLSRLAESVSPSINDKIRPRSLHEVLSSRNMSINVSNDDLGNDFHGDKVTDKHETRQVVGNGSEVEDMSMSDNFSESVNEVPVSVIKRDSSSKPHIQLDILAADKLMPASKGPISRDINGCRIPDRKPCLRITLYFPNNIEKRPAYKTGRDFTVTTLNPRWNSTFYLPLSCPRQVIQGALDECVESGIDIANPNDVVVSKVNKALVDWWSSGFISIQVIDGERFNEDIFLGEVTLLLSAFLVPPASKSNAPVKTVDNDKCKSMHGTFPLSKLHAHDRVSGSLKLASYLHLAHDVYIKEIISKTVSSSLAPTTMVAEPSTAVGRSPEGKKVSSYSRRQTMDALSKNLDVLGKDIQETTNALVDRMNMKLAARMEEKLLHQNAAPTESHASTMSVTHDLEVQYFSAKKHPLIPKITKIISLEDSDSVIVDEDSNDSSSITDDYLEIVCDYENDENEGVVREKDSTRLKKVTVNLDLTNS